MRTETQKKTPTAINTFSNGVGYEINTQKSATFLHANIKHTEKEIREIISFTIASSKKKNGINLIKEVRNVCNKNFEELKKIPKMHELVTLMLGK